MVDEQLLVYFLGILEFSCLVFAFSGQLFLRHLGSVLLGGQLLGLPR